MPIDNIGSITDFDSYRGYLLVLAEGRIGPWLRSKIDPTDVVQQTLLRACEHAAAFRGGERELRAWLRSILANVIRDWLRKVGGVTGERERSFEACLERSSRRLEGLLEDDCSSPSHKARRNESVLALADALARLPEDQRVAIDLRHLRDQPLAMIAEHMGKTVPAVAGLLRRGLESLRADLKELS